MAREWRVRVNEGIKGEVEAGYDHVAGSYLSGKDPKDPLTLGALEDLALRLPAGARVLDLGCGAGVPATRWLSERFEVTGVDLSQGQLDLARKNAPNARLVKADMASVEFEEASFDAVVSLLSIIHVPREEHPALFERVHTWLNPGGFFLAQLSVGEWEGSEEDWQGWGATMWWSHHDREKNLAMLAGAGFEVVSEEAKTERGPGGEEETWLWALARKGLEERRSQ